MKYLAHSVPICLLITLGNWNLAQVHAAHIYRGQLIFSEKIRRNQWTYTPIWLHQGQVWLGTMSFSVSWRYPWTGSFQKIWSLSSEEVLAPWWSSAKLLGSQFMKISPQRDNSGPFREDRRALLLLFDGFLFWINILSTGRKRTFKAPSLGKHKSRML